MVINSSSRLIIHRSWQTQMADSLVFIFYRYPGLLGSYSKANESS